MTEFYEDHGPCDECGRTLVIRKTRVPVDTLRWLCSECVRALPPGQYVYERKVQP